jgi:hypothetical protein
MDGPIVAAPNVRAKVRPRTTSQNEPKPVSSRSFVEPGIAWRPGDRSSAFASRLPLGPGSWIYSGGSS